LPALAERGRPYRIQYESKSNMTPQRMDLAQDGGIFYMQLGIESFSTPVLARMKKGCTALQNIYAIHGLMRRGITPYYNLLFGFPGDQVSDYERMTEILPTLFHLKPPGLCIWVQITRYAPMSERPLDFGHAEPLTSHWRYDSLFSPEFLDETGLDLTKFCYYFDNYNHPMMGAELRNQFSVLQQQWWHWRNREQKMGSHLSFRADDDGMDVRDTRSGQKPKITRWSAVHRDLYLAVDGKLAEREQVYKACGQHDRQRVADAIEELEAAQLMLTEGRHVLSLAFPREVYDQGIFWWHDEVDRFTYLNHNHRSILERRRQRALEEVPAAAQSAVSILA
ncbi:MAG: hypothetical protein MI919_16320, partial [Holophagales bacterium]|nr:hypothetical protein [Holophagales bacterium]